MVNSKLDSKGLNFKPLRGIAPSSRKELLNKVNISFSELGTACKYIKKMVDVKTQFMRYMDASSWEVAECKYPEYTKKERLETFLDLPFKGDTIPPLFVAYCKQAKCSAIACIQDSPDISEDCSIIQVQSLSVVLHKREVLQLEDKDFLSSPRAPYNGIDLTILDPPKVLTRCTTFASL